MSKKGIPIMANKKIRKLTPEQKLRFMRGVGWWNTFSVEECNIPSLRMSDGPIGIRKEVKDEKSGETKTETSVCFPSGALLSCSFDPEVFSKLGNTLSKEAKNAQVQVVLGPAMNIKRSPLGGRGFEYLSEDPYLTYRLSSSYVKAMEKEGVGACLKHFAVNSSEANRMVINEIVDERTLREIYLYPFQKTIADVQPAMVMASYNKVNGLHSTENPYLLKDMLRNEFGFNGVVVSDWLAVNDPVLSIYNGLNLEMPQSYDYTIRKQVDEYMKSEKFRYCVDVNVDRILNMIEKYPASEAKEQDFEEDHQIAKELAEKSIVLLKNDGMLPLKKEEKLAVIGPFAKAPRYQGGGSSHINSYRVKSFVDCLEGVDYQYDEGCSLERTKKAPDVRKAVELAKNADKVLLFLGIDERYETEGMDRESLRLPSSQLELLKEIKKVNSNIVVVLSSGGPLEMPFIDDVKAVLDIYLGGEAIMEALTDILYGKVNPSGHLAETFPLSVADNPSYPYFPGDRFNCLYKEGIYVGYRYYETFEKPVLFPFGYGLSYSTFSYSDFAFHMTRKTVTFTITNTSAVKGEAVPQIYITKPSDEIFNSKAELVAFTKVSLEPGESKKIELEINRDALRYFNVDIHEFVDLYGNYKISLRTDAHTVVEEKSFSFNGKNKNLPYDVSKLPSYYKDGIHKVSDDEYKELYKKELPLAKTTGPFTLDNSFAQAYDAGSFGAKVILWMVSKFSDVKDNAVYYKLVEEGAVRSLMYNLPGSSQHEEDFLNLLNGKKVLRSFAKVAPLLTMKK